MRVDSRSDMAYSKLPYLSSDESRRGSSYAWPVRKTIDQQACSAERTKRRAAGMRLRRRRKMAGQEAYRYLVASQHSRPTRVSQRNYSAWIFLGASTPRRIRHGHDFVCDRYHLATQGCSFAGWNRTLRAGSNQSDKHFGPADLFRRRNRCRPMGVEEEMPNQRLGIDNGPFMGGSGADPWDDGSPARGTS